MMRWLSRSRTRSTLISWTSSANVETAGEAEGMLIAEIEHIVESDNNKALPDIKELFKRELKMNLAESGVAVRVMDYVRRFKRIVADNGLTECFRLERGTREKCKRPIFALKPPMLKPEVKHIHMLLPRETPRCCFDSSSRRRQSYLRLKMQKREASGRKEKPKAKQHCMQKDRQGRFAEKAKVKPNLKNNKNQDTKPKSSSKPSPGPCPKCEKMHWIREGPDATEDEKTDLLKRFRNARMAKKAKRKQLGDLLPTADRTVLLNGVLELPYCPDSDSDHTVIGLEASAYNGS
ncbi:hypothetical protein DVH05_009354 [Phytophthora capsici]|nr:hypothetical protein DVH05_009354 [Phytophthora capsici]